MINTQEVHIITFQGREFDRTTTPWELAQMKEDGIAKYHGNDLVYDFR